MERSQKPVGRKSAGSPLRDASGWRWSVRSPRRPFPAGYSLVELLVAISIFGVVTLVGLPHIDTRREDINTSIQRVVADMRYARGRAITSGEHYAMEWTGASSYEVQRMRLDPGGNWELDHVERTVELPEHISFTLGDDGVDRLEFNTRGMMISSTKPLFPVISDLDRRVDHRFSIWPSGQIYVED